MIFYSTFARKKKVCATNNSTEIKLQIKLEMKKNEAKILLKKKKENREERNVVENANEGQGVFPFLLFDFHLVRFSAELQPE